MGPVPVHAWTKPPSSRQTLCHPAPMLNRDQVLDLLQCERCCGRCIRPNGAFGQPKLGSDMVCLGTVCIPVLLAKGGPGLCGGRIGVGTIFRQKPFVDCAGQPVSRIPQYIAIRPDVLGRAKCAHDRNVSAEQFCHPLHTKRIGCRALAQKYMGGSASGILTFGVKGGYEAGVKFYDQLKLFKRLVNIGDAKSLACHPASTTHRQMTAQEQRASGVTPEAIRLSVGIEHIDDILEDLDQALS